MYIHSKYVRISDYRVYVLMPYHSPWPVLGAALSGHVYLIADHFSLYGQRMCIYCWSCYLTPSILSFLNSSLTLLSPFFLLHLFPTHLHSLSPLLPPFLPPSQLTGVRAHWKKCRRGSVESSVAIMRTLLWLPESCRESHFTILASGISCSEVCEE